MSDTGSTKQETEAPDEEAEGQEDDHSGGLGSGGSKMLLLGYVGIIALVILGLLLLLSLGSGLKPPAQQGGGARDPRSKINADKVLWHILLGGAFIIVTARVFGRLAHKFHQPHLIGQIIGGILLGPSLLGQIWPSAFEFLFPENVMTYLDVLAQLGLIFYMFIVGIELDFRLLRDRDDAVNRMTLVGIVPPLVLGVVLAPWFHPRFAGDESFLPFALFLGVAMSATGFPVLARILTDRGLFKTRIGRLALTVGASTYVATWCLLAIVLVAARASGFLGTVLTIAVLMLFIAFMVYGLRPVLQRVSSYYERRGALSGTFLAALFVGLLLSALITDKLKLHVIFGAFLFGVIMPHASKFVGELTEKLEDFSVVFLLPFFFAFSGIRTDIFAIGGSASRWLMTLAILAVAILGKWGGSKLAARFAGLDWREAGALGVLVNCRGLTELIILNIGFQLGILSPALFAMLVIMAVVTTLMTEPALARYYPRAEQRRMVKEEAEGGEGDEDDEDRWKIVVAVGNPEVSEELTHVATLVGGDREEEVEVTLVRVVDVSGTEVSHAAAVQDTALQEATDRLRPLREVVEDAGFDANPVVIAGDHKGDTISRVANELDADLVLMGYHEALFGHRLLGGTVGQVLHEARADVAVLVDPEGPRQFSLGEDARILVPYGGKFHEEAGLDLALRLARATGANLTLLAPGGEEAEERAAEARDGSGVDFELVAVDGDITEALFERAADFDLLVLGVSDRWMTDDETLASVREEVMEKAGTAYLLVRRHGGARGHLRRWWAKAKRAPKVVAAVYRSEGDDVADAPRRAGEETRQRLDDPDGQGRSEDSGG
ncbi:MAG: cation:proton antiporter [Actinomycetota bacterium]|nr:cation:proton antiporter [Actinomycetota bacterium]